MKTNIFLLLSLFGMVVCSSCASSKKSSSELVATSGVVKRQMEEKDITVQVDHVYPLRGKSYVVNHGYYLTLRKDTVCSYLPYLGVAYTSHYGGGNALDFKAPFTDYVSTVDKKGAYNISFSVQTAMDRFVFHLKVYDNGRSSIYVQPVNRQSISYDGYIDEK